MDKFSALKYGLLILVALVFFRGSAFSEEAAVVVLNVRLNMVDKGDFYMMAAPDGDYLVKTEELKKMGFKAPQGAASIMEGAEHISLKSMQGVRFVYNEDAVALEITAEPSLLARTVIDYAGTIYKGNVEYTGDGLSAFFNYKLSYNAGMDFKYESSVMTNEAGVRGAGLLLKTDTVYTDTDSGATFRRLQSNVTYDRRNELQRITGGDFFASSGDFGTTLNMGGLSIAKIYRMDPYFIKQPLFNVTGQAAVPSEVEVYLDGALIKKEKLAPGEFELRNISAYSGAGNYEILIRDSYGREQRMRYPFYYADQLLKSGLHEYSYNAGLIRKDFGVKSAAYGSPAFSALHRYGFGETLTVGAGAEASGGTYVLTPQISYGMADVGVLDMALSGSEDETTGEGWAGLASHRYDGRPISSRVIFRQYNRDYMRLSSTLTGVRTKFEIGAGISYSQGSLGAASLDYTATKIYEGAERRTTSTTYSISPFEESMLSFTLRNRRTKAPEGDESANELFVNFSYYPWKDISASVSWQRSKDVDTETAQIQRSAPTGEGYGYRMAAARVDGPAAHITTVSPYAQYNGRYARVAGEFNGQYGAASQRSERSNLSIAGGIGYVGNRLGLGRPISDSFAVVKADGLRDVSIMRSGQEIGKTDSVGYAFVPELGSYINNTINLDTTAIPMDYVMNEAARTINPALRSGTYLDFNIRKIQAVTGRLRVKSKDGLVKDAEFYEVSMAVKGEELLLPTGKGGEFYMENIPAGQYTAAARYAGETCAFEIVIPESAEAFVDLGEVLCE